MSNSEYYLSNGQRVYTHPDEFIKHIDHSWFVAHPDKNSYLREPLPGEFDGRLPSPQPGNHWRVHVRAFRDPINGQVIMRTRTPVQVNR